MKDFLLVGTIFLLLTAAGLSLITAISDPPSDWRSSYGVQVGVAHKVRTPAFKTGLVFLALWVLAELFT